MFAKETIIPQGYIEERQETKPEALIATVMAHTCGKDDVMWYARAIPAHVVFAVICRARGLWLVGLEASFVFSKERARRPLQ